MKPFLGIKYWGYRSQSNAVTELMVADLPHVDYDEKKKLTKKELSGWEAQMEALKDASPKKINLNEFIIDGEFRKP